MKVSLIIVLHERYFRNKLGARNSISIICDALRNLVPFVQFKKREKTHGGVHAALVHATKPATLLKLALLHRCFSRFLNRTNSTKSLNASHFSN